MNEFNKLLSDYKTSRQDRKDLKSPLVFRENLIAHLSFLIALPASLLIRGVLNKSTFYEVDIFLGLALWLLLLQSLYNF